MQRELPQAYRQGATLFFHEVEDLPADTQKEVYRFMESLRSKNEKYRIIASCRQDLKPL